MAVALDSGVEVFPGVMVKVESANVVSTAILLANGATISVDLIIAADGLHVRDTCFRIIQIYY